MNTKRIYHLTIVSTEKKIFDDFVYKVLVKSGQGELGIYSQHTPLLTIIKPGIIDITKQSGEKKYIYITGGILEIQPNSVIVLADRAIYSRDLDRIRLLKSKCKIEEYIHTAEEYIHAMNVDVAYYAKKHLLKDIARLRLIEMSSHKANKK